MKKKIFIILFCIGTILSIHRCSNNRIGEKSDIQVSQGDVTLTIKDGTLTKTGVTVIVKNNSDRKVRYGASFELEIKKHGEWHKIDVYTTQWFQSSAVVLDPGQSREMEHGFGAYGKLRRGRYRIIKDMAYESGKYEEFNVAVEFTIK